MYIKSARITNIRSIEDFEINFEEPAGWHVLIGDNGSGKSTIIRSLALALIRSDEVFGLRGDWKEWLQKGKDVGMIWILLKGRKVDLYSGTEKENFSNSDVFTSNVNVYFRRSKPLDTTSKVMLSLDTNLPVRYKPDIDFFSAAFGPYRRFTGGNQEWSKVFTNQPKLAAHLSAFSEDVALTEPVEWLMHLNHQDLEHILSLTSSFKAIYSGDEALHAIDDYENNSSLGCIKKMINETDLLPNNTRIDKISSEGVFFEDGDGYIINVNQLSSGYISVTSVVFELIRQLVIVYGEEAVFENIRKDDMRITLPGVVLIDEIDAHLHPTWQTKIGQWFLKYFPNLQFIVTTHSPLVCRAAEKGTIWKLAAPGSGEKSEQVTGIERERLIKGNILDAYGTEVFGKDVTISKEASGEINRLAELNLKSMMGDTDEREEVELQQLKSIYPTEKVG